ncbi:MAG: hypothetical protein F6K26_08915 [Moorea sp. SIO2I5]|nr:hypothetical protein [Moorena sp. SIO2I5]
MIIKGSEIIEKGRPLDAENPPRFSIEWSPSYNFCVDFEKGSDRADECEFDPGNAAGIGGFGNSTTTYITAWIDRKYGEVLVVRGKKPKTPTTYFGDPIFHEGDLRYFTWATNGSMYNAAVTDSVFDEEMPVDENGYYTVVVSRPSYRPKKARYECGYAWVEFPPNGDGAGDIYLAELRNRWQLADENFEEAPQNQCRKKPGKEPKFMGEYFPVGEYMSPEEFDQNFECKLRLAQ